MKPRYPVLGLGATVCLLVTISICVLFTHNHVSSSGAGSALCMPGLSIRCEPDDCGSFYVRCGRYQKRQEVPANKVCYKGALISVNSRMHSSGLLPHNCRGRTSYARNSTIEFDLRGACNCLSQCSGTAVCVCYCVSGNGNACKCSNGKTYANSAQAQCCIPSCRSCVGAELDVSFSWYWSMWTEALDLGQVLISSFLKKLCDSVRNRFTFPPTMLAEVCCTSNLAKCNTC